MLIKARWYPYVAVVLMFLFAMMLAVHEASKTYIFSDGDLTLRFGESEAGTFEATVVTDNPNLSCKLYVQKGKERSQYELKPNVYQTFGFTYGDGDYKITLYKKDNKSNQKNDDYIKAGQVTVNASLSGIIPHTNVKTEVKTETKTAAKTVEKPVVDTSASYDAVWELRNYTHENGKSINYWINVPEGATSGMPIVLFLHGDGEMNKPNAVAKLKQVQYMRESKDFISIAPVGTSGDWVSDKTQVALKALLDECISKYKIDTSRVYIWGFSRGAIGTWEMVERYGSFFAAAVPISCGSNGAIVAENFSDTKVFALAGSQESKYVSLMKSLVKKITDAGGSAKFEAVAGQSHSSISANFPYTEVIDNWLLLQ